MSATDTAVRTWPTIGEADEVVALLRHAYNRVDELSVRCHGLIDLEEPWEKPAETPAPTLENVAALARVTTHLRDHVEGSDRQNMRDWLRDLEQMLESAVVFEAQARGERA